MSTDKFLHSAMRTSCAALCQAIGWNATQSTALDVLSDVLQRYFMDIAKKTHRYAEHSGRTDPNLDDLTLVLEDMHVSIPELEEYVQNFDPVQFPVSVPKFPIERESHLNFLRPGSEEVLTRPVHVHEYMPPMIFEEEPKAKKDKLEVSEMMHMSTPPSSSSLPTLDKLENGEVMEPPEKQPAPVVNGKVNGMDGDSKGMDSESDSDNSLLPSSVISPKSSKSKRLESPGENPALKRVRMMLEEEGHPLREITSVMMTTSGFLTSSREGRLPDTKPPPNRDFFEPVVAPVPEKKKKIPTMKKIVEGVKRIDKEKENHSDKDKNHDSGFNLFEKPDKIFSSPAASSSAAAAADKNWDKDSGVEKAPKEGKEKSKEKKDKSEKRAERAEKKAKAESDKQKLKIFKKKKIPKDLAKEKTPTKVKTPKVEVDAGLDLIESDEDFGASGATQSRETSPEKPSRKKDKLLSTPKIKEKKLKLKSPMSVTPIGKMKMSKTAKAAPLRIFENPDKIVPVLIGAQKKKRGRPKKAVSPFALMEGLHALQVPPPPPPSLKSKFSRKMLAAHHDDLDMKSFVPEISINVKPPPPPDFLRLPLQPGLIPAYVPPSNLKNPLPPSISITPATPTITPSSPLKEGSRGSAQFSSLPSNVCSSVTITRIDMSNSQKLPTPFDSQPTPGIGSPNLSNKSSSSSAATIVPLQNDSGITITPIVMDKKSGSVEKERPIIQQQQQPPPPPPPQQQQQPQQHSGSGLAKLEQNLRTKEQRRKEKEKRKELKKEKKKEKREKEKLKEKEREKSSKKDKEKDKDRVERSSEKERDKSLKKEKKDKDKSEKKRKKEKEVSVPLEPSIPKLTLKLQHSSTTTPVESPNPPPSYPIEDLPPPPPRKIIIKPIEEIKQRSPSPEMARFSPLVTRPSKKVPLPKKSPPAPIPKTPKQEHVVSFPPAVPSSASSTSSANTSSSNSKRGRGRPPKTSKPPSKSSTQAGLITETVGSYIDEHGNKVWICPACGRQDDGSPMIGCEKCDDWYHFTCVGIVEAPDETESWFCKKCVVKSSSSSSFDRKKGSRL